MGALQPKLVPVGNVRAALAAVETNVSTPPSLCVAVSARRATLAFVVAGPGAPRIVYPAAVVAASRNRAEAERFLTFLRRRKGGRRP